MMYQKIEEQTRVLENDKKNMLVSASAGSGKTSVMIKYITTLVCEKKVPISDFIVLTFTKAAAREMKERLQASLREKGDDPFIVEQIDNLSTANITTIDSFCEKYIKKYANYVGLNENFEIADESFSQKICAKAFEKALKILAETGEDDYFSLMEYYKNNEGKIQKIVSEIEKLTNSVANSEEFVKKNVENLEKSFDKATKDLFDKALADIRANLQKIEVLHVEDYAFTLRKDLDSVLKSKDIVEMSQAIPFAKLTQRPGKNIIGEDVAELVGKCKDNISLVLKKIGELNLDDEENFAFQRSGKLEKMMLKLFAVYKQEQDRIKRALNCLDFADLEKYMVEISKHENLFDGLQYVFVDEYQDTNRLQERIVKNVAKNCNFVAVGDAKQGIYGFRLATCEILLDDIEKFEADENSVVNYLKSNFRSDQRVLDFVNDVFKVCMKKDLTGIDYLDSSMLEARNVFEDDGTKAVSIDIVKEQEKVPVELPEIYSVKNDKVRINSADLKQMLDVKNRIFEVMNGKVFEKDSFRQCKYSDIAILVRDRKTLFNNLELFLSESGIPVASNSKIKLTEEVEIQILINLLKVCLNFDDEISLLSVLLSPFGGFSLEELIELKGDKSLCEIVQSDERFETFRQRVDRFNKSVLYFGARRALLEIFNETNYRAYINIKPLANKLNRFVDLFLQVVGQSGLEFDLPALIHHFEVVDFSVNQEIKENTDSVILTTIHNSKGLEYPIVFLVGCDKSLTSNSENYDIKINENYGLALKYYDVENNQDFVGARMRAISNEKKLGDFVEELMVFYVALTRAKNKLFLFGKHSKNMFNKKNLEECDSYFDLIFHALDNARVQLLENGCFETDNLGVRVLDDVVEENLCMAQERGQGQYQKEDLRKIVDYLNFEYRFDGRLNFKLKETVTGLNNRHEEKLETFSNENFVFGGATVETGNAYHSALELLDFDEIESVGDIAKQFEENRLLADVENLIDKEILLKNILAIKSLKGDGKYFKEQPFILKEKLCNLLDGETLEDEIMLQGVVDLFILKKDEIVLVDFKYSNTQNPLLLVERYKNQLKYYKIALENFFKKPVKEKYLLSLKNSKLIKV